MKWAAIATWEVIFRPDAGGAPAQRFFHLQERGTATRMPFEIRTADGAARLGIGEFLRVQR